MNRCWTETREIMKERFFWIYLTISFLVYLFGALGIGYADSNIGLLAFWAFMVIVPFLIVQQVPLQRDKDMGKKTILYTLLTVGSLIWVNLYAYEVGAQKTQINTIILLFICAWGFTFLEKWSFSFCLLVILTIAYLLAFSAAR